MDNNEKNTSGYTPNFILKAETEPENKDSQSQMEEKRAEEKLWDTKSKSEPSPWASDATPEPNPWASDARTKPKVKVTPHKRPADPRDNFKTYNKTKGKKDAPIVVTKKTLVLFLVICLVFSGLVGFGTSFIGNSLKDSPKKPSSISTEGYKLKDATNSNMSIQEITKKAENSIVEIKTESASSDPWMQEFVTEGAGSGVIITDDGYIVTNNHVVSGANKVTVTVADEKQYEAKLIGTDEITDVAVIKINANDLTPAIYGNSDQLEVGDLAVAIGNPLGTLGGTVTAGIISSLDRELSIEGSTMRLLQTDTSINPGNSGGGLFNDDANLIGIVVAKSSGSDVEGLGFAIPINTAAKVAQELMDNGFVSGQPFTGMGYNEAETGNNMFGSKKAVYIASVEGENAKKAGFKPGDIVVAIDDKKIDSFATLSSIITSHKPKDIVTYKINRDNEMLNIKLEIGEKTAND